MNKTSVNINMLFTINSRSSNSNIEKQVASPNSNGFAII